MPTNFDTIALIADFIQPSPVVYTRLAMVNKDFYKVFTSDKLWARLDAYEKTTGIFGDFIERIPTFERIMAACWLPIYSNRQFDPELVDNLYVRLGWFLDLFAHRADFPQSIKTSYPWLTQLIKGLNNGSMHLYGAETSDEDKVWDLCVQEPIRLCFASDSLRNNPDFMCRFIDATKHLYTGMGFVHPTSHPEIIDHAIRVNPGAIYPFGEFNNPPLKTRFRRLITTRQALLQSIRGNPKYLDYFPEYWDDHEVCMAALEPGPKLIGPNYTFSTRWKFLKKCKDEEVIARALQHYPDSIICAPAKYRKSVSAIKYALENENILCDLEELGHIDPKPFMDVAVMEVCMDRGYLEGYEYPAPDHFNHMCGQLEWMKDRVKSRPSSWYFASEELQNNKDLLLAAMEGNKMIKAMVPKISDDHAYLYLDMVPEALEHDQEVLDAVLDMCAIDALPGNMCTEAMIRRYIAAGNGVVLEDGFPYEVVRAAVMEDVNQIRFCSKNLERFAEDPVMAPFIKKYIYDIDWHCGRRRHGPKFAFGERPDWGKIDRDSALRLFKQYPGNFEQVCDLWLDTEFVIDAVKSNGHIFGHLRQEFQDDKQVQMAIGPLSKKSLI